MTRIELERRRRRWNQTTLGYHARLGQGDISRIERRLSVPSPRIAGRLGAVLGIAPERLLDEVPAEEAAGVR